MSSACKYTPSSARGSARHAQLTCSCSDAVCAAIPPPLAIRIDPEIDLATSVPTICSAPSRVRNIPVRATMTPTLTVLEKLRKDMADSGVSSCLAAMRWYPVVHMTLMKLRASPSPAKNTPLASMLPWRGPRTALAKKRVMADMTLGKLSLSSLSSTCHTSRSPAPTKTTSSTVGS
eukprot:760667-Hanusia_phi.AAC.2